MLFHRGIKIRTQRRRVIPNMFPSQKSKFCISFFYSEICEAHPLDVEGCIDFWQTLREEINKELGISTCLYSIQMSPCLWRQVEENMHA